MNRCLFQSGGQSLSEAIVNNKAKYNSFVLDEGALAKSSTMDKFSDMAQHRDNASQDALSCINAAQRKAIKRQNIK